MWLDSEDILAAAELAHLDFAKPLAINPGTYRLLCASLLTLFHLLALIQKFCVGFYFQELAEEVEAVSAVQGADDGHALEPTLVKLVHLPGHDLASVLEVLLFQLAVCTWLLGFSLHQIEFINENL